MGYTHHRLMTMYQLRNVLEALLAVQRVFDLVESAYSHTENNRVVEDWALQEKEAVEAEINALVTEAYNRGGIDADDRYELDLIVAKSLSLHVDQPFEVAVTVRDRVRGKAAA